jgi:oligosaccharyltransferase complex subunit gamma
MQVSNPRCIREEREEKMIFFGFFCLLSYCLADQAADNTATLTRLSNDGNEQIAFDSDSFKKATQGPRNYALFVILTALNPQFNCLPCKLLHKEFQDLQYSVSKSEEKGRIFVGFLDYSANTQDIFASMNLQAVPHLRIYYPNAGPHAKDTDYEVVTLSTQ